ncbi:hypothetical protein ACFQ5D_20560 [Paenibacillus farraposensis]|uniref:Uncharacterized protein n=1 Tax=Paenibacillus farraposensis TaxID=2807095 RepID=A0ABW4DKA6_9BACL|nr:hypothetical protein [Paenibacillus farraposensis]MCC3379297.1 hypothetical protein [Paenibacillus farraposensis]
MEANHAIYSDELLELITGRLSREMKEVFGTIWNSRNSDGVSWSELLEIHKNRKLMEKALIALEVSGFIEVDSNNTDKRKKHYVPDKIRGKQLAKFLAAKFESE